MKDELCLINALKRISQWLQLHDPQPSIIYPGLSDLQIEKLTQKLPFQLPLEVCELFHFCNGGLGITPDLVTYSLERSIESCVLDVYNEVELFLYNTKKGLMDFQYYYPDVAEMRFHSLFYNYPFNEYKFPLFSQKEIYYVLCSSEKKDFSTVWCKFPREEPQIYASNLTSLMLTYAECYETGAYYVEDCYVKIGGETYFAEDRHKVELIFEKYNPQYINIWRSIWKD